MHLCENNVANIPQEIPTGVSPHKQIIACRDTLFAILAIKQDSLAPKKLEIIQQAAKLFSQCAVSGFNSENLAKRIIKTTVSGVVNTFIIDEICPSGTKNIGERRYGRVGWLDENSARPAVPFDFADQPLPNMPTSISRLHFARHEEMETYTEALQKNSTLQPVSNLTELLALFSQKDDASHTNYYFTSPISASDMDDIVRLHDQEQRITTIFPFSLNHTYGGYALSGANVKDIDMTLFIPQSEPARQDILEAMLEEGIPLINQVSNSDEYSTQNFSDDFTEKKAVESLNDIWKLIVDQVSVENTADRISVKQAWVYAMTSQRNTVKLAKRIEERLKTSYKEALEAESNLVSDIYLTRTGLSANILGIEVANKFFDGETQKPLVYIYDGFYYEARMLTEGRFQTTDDYKDDHAQIYAINIAPNVPNPSLSGAEEYSSRRDEIIQYVVQKARETPNKNYFLIIDKTTNLQFSLFSAEDTPENLYIFESASLTKHRRGDKKHFSGIVLYKGHEKLKPSIEASLAAAHAIPSTRDLHFFHNLSRDEIRDTAESLQLKSDIFTEAFTKEMMSVREDWKWKVKRYHDQPQFIFLIPPIEAMIKLSQETMGYSKDIYMDKTGTSNVRELTQQYKTFLENLIDYIREPFFTTDGFEKSSSFGLVKTLLTTLPGIFIYDGNTFLQDIPRICFGLRTKTDELKNFAVLVSNSLKKGMPRETILESEHHE